MAERKLASIQKIIEIKVHPNADSLEIAQILGWQAIISKDDKYKAGDLVCYFEIDSFLPIAPEYEFLRKSSYKKIKEKDEEGFRIKTIKLRNALSQGLIMPLSILQGKKFPEDTRENPVYEFEEGKDVTKLLGVKKYEPYIPPHLSGEVKGAFPSFIQKTDQTRIQILRPLIDRYKGTKFSASEKLNGCLHYRTFIKTELGNIPIGKIVNNKLKVNIFSYNHNLNKIELKEIIKFHRYPAQNWIRIGVSHRRKGNREKFIECTYNHKFWTDKGYKEAKDLVIGDNCYQIINGVSEEVKQMILGCFLGDSSLHYKKKCNNNYYLFQFGHSIKQNDYFEYKKKLLGELFSEQKKRISGFGSIMRRGILRTNLDLFNYIAETCVKNKKRFVNEKWLNQLTPMAIAFWYMDDGTIHDREELKQRPKAYICTNRYSLEEVKLMQEMFKRKYNLDSIIGDKKTYKGHILMFDTLSSERFFDLIFPYVTKSMKYKLPIKYENLPCVYEDYIFKNNTKILSVKVISIKKEYNPAQSKLTSNKFVYDLTIKDNHNYFANGILTHNSSVTFFIKDNEFGVCSRNLELKETAENSIWKWARRHDVENKLRSLGKNIAISGEICGPGINGNTLALTYIDVYFFDAFDIDNYRYYDLNDFKDILENKLKLKTVPILWYDFVMIDNIDELIKMAIGNSKINPKVMREGLVFRPLKEIRDLEVMPDNNGRVSFKVINNEYLLKNEE